MYNFQPKIAFSNMVILVRSILLLERLGNRNLFNLAIILNKINFIFIILKIKFSEVEIN